MPRALEKFNFVLVIPLLYILVLLATFCIMEAITWLTHKYVMHGFLWVLHRDHHQVEPGILEKNDSFFVIFAIPSMLLIYFGTFNHVWWMQAIGFGIMMYGFAYFIVHDVIIQSPQKILYQFPKSTRFCHWIFFGPCRSGESLYY